MEEKVSSLRPQAQRPLYIYIYIYIWQVLICYLPQRWVPG